MRFSKLLLIIFSLLSVGATAQSSYQFYMSQKDSLESVRYNEDLTKNAELGDANSQFILGYHYIDGYYVEGIDAFNPLNPNVEAVALLEADGEKAFEWLLKSANQNFVFAQFEVAEFLYSPAIRIYNDTIDDIEAIKLAEDFFLKAAEQNCPLSMVRLFELYYIGETDYLTDTEVIKAQPEKGFQYLKKSADMGNVNAKLKLATEVYCNGLLAFNIANNAFAVEPNKNKALEILVEISNLEENSEAIEAFKILGDNYFYERNSIGSNLICNLELDQNYEKAFYYFKEIVDFYDDIDIVRSDYFFKLGLCYLHGYGVKESKSKAKRLIKLAAQYGLPKAQALWDSRNSW